MDQSEAIASLMEIGFPRGSWFGALIALFAFALGATAVTASAAEPMQAGQIILDCSYCPELVVVPAGSFLMGSSAAEATRDLLAVQPDRPAFVEQYLATEHPQRLVSITRPFALGRYLVTRGEFEAFVRATSYLSNGGCTMFANHRYIRQADRSWRAPGFSQTDRDPVVCVSWQDAQAYVAWLNSRLVGRVPTQREGPYRLPTEAEWEYAARAGTHTARWWGDAIGLDNADCDGCGSRWDKGQTAPVGSFRPNAFGLFDMLGNAWEWTQDCWNETYVGAPVDGTAWTAGECEKRVMRGGSFSNHPWILRSSGRSKSELPFRGNYIGFRVARTLP